MILPYQQAGNPWMLTFGMGLDQLGLKTGDTVDVLVVAAAGNWHCWRNLKAENVAWHNAAAMPVAWRPYVPGPTSTAAPAPIIGIPAAEAEIASLKISRDHYYGLWAEAEARRALTVVKLADTAHRLNVARGELAQLKAHAA
ncbi:hypothetical protein [Asticcacaulis solisilvae]|uniref:hypothetical protein n=1 Tax=Asticcacaulis solisilvae TaxID=1217274 RepID=UPI003FD81290